MESYQWPIRNPNSVKPVRTSILWLTILICVGTIVALDARLESLGTQNRELQTKLESCNTGTPMPQITE